MRKIKIAPGEYYHICNRGINRQIIFHDNRDYLRFLFLLVYFQSSLKIDHLSRVLDEFSKALGQHRVLATGYESEILKKRTIELVSFCLMPNHFHLIIKELKNDGIASYMQRILNAYGKYYNTKYQKSGHVFQGPYRAVHVENNDQLLYLSSYIHRNPRELKMFSNREDKYEWSSYQDFIYQNRFGYLLVPEIINGQFSNLDKYKKFVAGSIAKELHKELNDLATVNWLTLGVSQFSQGG